MPDDDLLSRRPPDPLGPWVEWMARWWATLSQPPWSRVTVGAMAALVVVVAFALLTRRPSAPPLVLPRAPAATASPDIASGSSTTGAPATITVHAAGALVRPGVYSVPDGARVADVVAAAGGTLAEADLDGVNLAAKVADAERVYVPREGETPPAPAPVPAGPIRAGDRGAPASPAPPVDLNTASAEQLDALPGVGPATAQAILGFRASHGRFRSVDDLLEVRGIGPAKLEALRPLVRV